MKQVFFVLLSIVIAHGALAQGITKNGRITTTGTEYVNKNGAIGTTAGVNKNGEIVAAVSLATVSTTAISAITAATASSGGNITNSGGGTISARGVCWATSSGPTTASSKTSDGTGTGSFTSNLTGLASGTAYYVRAYATNSAGTAYGNEVTFTTSVPLAVGVSYQGGIIAYIFQSGDLGYVAGEIHGLIAASADLSTAAWGCNSIFIAGTVSGIGSGDANTTLIMNGCATAGIAARECADLTLNGYSDWYLPSIDELNILITNKDLIGGFAAASYWSSTQQPSGFNFTEQAYMNYNGAFPYGKSNSLNVRPVRSF